MGPRSLALVVLVGLGTAAGAAAAEPPTAPLSSALARLGAERARLFRRGVPVVLGLAAEGKVEPAVERLAQAGAEVTWVEAAAGLDQVGLLVPAERLDDVRRELSVLPGLAWADLQPPVRLRNAASAWRCQSGIPGEEPVFEHGLLGEGQVIGLMDTGIDADDCYFVDLDHGLPVQNDDSGTAVDLEQRKVLAVDFYWAHDWPDPGPHSWDSMGHGTHVAGSAAGDRWPLGRHNDNDGMAPAARLVVQDGGYLVDDCADLPGLGCPVRPLGPVFAQAYAQGARIHSDSWGDEENIQPYNRYTERTADVDRFCWEHKDFTVFFAAGNAGWAPDTVSSPATGKNVVGVGATVHGDREPPCVAAFSSRGWTQDGRIKPDLVVPGGEVVSAGSDGDVTTGNCDEATMSGTSMAAPTAAGLTALVRQYYVDGLYPDGVPDPTRGFEPSSALLRATLIAAAVDLVDLGCDQVDPVPSRDQGWGLLVLDRALVFPGAGFRLLAYDHRSGFSGAADPPVQLPLEVESTGPLKVVLVWTDPPSTSLATVNLVNDLDLEVVGPDGLFRGNVFANGVSVEGGEADRRNPVEVVWRRQASPGRWTVTVRPHNVAVAPQDFALVVTGVVSAQPPRRPQGRLGRP